MLGREPKLKGSRIRLGKPHRDETPARAGQGRLALNDRPVVTTVSLATAMALGFDSPDIWDTVFLEELERWLKNLPCMPYVSIAHIVGLQAEC